MKLLRIVISLTVLLLLFYVQAETVHSGTTGSLVWSIDNGVLTITGTGNMPDYSIRTISVSEDEYETNAPWYGCDYSSIIIGEGITSIGSAAFSDNEYLQTVQLPSTLKEIHSDAFTHCYNLNWITLPKSLVSIGNRAFYHCWGLKTKLPDSLKSIGDHAFEECHLCSYTDFTIPGSVDYIGDYAFAEAGYYTLNNFIILGEAPKHISETAFQFLLGNITYYTGPSWNGKLKNYGGVITWKPIYTSGVCNDGITWYLTDDGEIVFDGVGTIMDVSSYWKYLSSLTSIKLLSKDLRIPSYVISNNFSHIRSFSGPCGDHATWAVSDGILKISGTGDMYDYASYDQTPWFVLNPTWYTDITNGYTSLVVEEGITHIGTEAFGRLRGGEIKLPSTLTSVGNYAFYYAGITALEMDDNLESVGVSAFSWCTELRSLHISTSLSVLDSNVFNACHGLVSIEIPDSVVDIQRTAFHDCGNLEEVHCCCTSVAIDYFDDSLLYLEHDASARAAIAVPATESTDGYVGYDYCEACGKESVIDKINTNDALLLPTRVRIIEAEAFSGTNEVQVTIPKGVKRIESRAFANCSRLALVVIPDSVVYIADDAFEGCDDIIIICTNDSFAHTFCIEKGFTYIASTVSNLAKP